MVLLIYKYNHEYKYEIVINDQTTLKVLFQRMTTLWVGSGRWRLISEMGVPISVGDDGEGPLRCCSKA